MPGTTDGGSGRPVRLVVLRHGHIASHRGDIPLTDEGCEQARTAGQWFAGEGMTFTSLLASPTRRTIETAEHFSRGYTAERPDAGLPKTQPSVALRNPDLYLGGHHVNMVSSAEAFRAQAPSMTEDEILRVPFFAEFLTAPDRIGYWLEHSHPPGDTAHAVRIRLEAFVRSLGHVPGWSGKTVLGITHSPVLRAIALTFLGTDPGEPPYLHGYSFTLGDDGAVVVGHVAPATRPAELPQSQVQSQVS